MLERLGNLWWSFLIRGIFAVIFAICAVVWPQLTVSALVLLFGGYLVVDGILAIIGAFVPIPFITEHGFWVVVVAYVILACGNIFRGF